MNKIMSEYIKSRSLRLGRNRVAQRGIALIMTLLILSMVIMLSLGMVIALSSQTFIGGYYRNFRGSFYAADSGLNVARQALANQLTSSVPGTFATPPIANPTAVASTVLSTMLGNYGSSSTLNVGTAANSWSESFKITNASFSLAIGPTITATDSNAADCSPQPAPCPTAYSYTYAYSLTSVGSAQGTEKTTVTENGDIILNISGASANSSVSFAYFGGFVDKYPACLGPLVPGTMTGPMFTNDAWEFMPSMAPWTSPYIFTDPVGQHDSSAYYWDTGWGCHSSATTSYGSGANLVAPTFEAGFNMNQPKVPLPTNSFSQEWAVLDGRGTGEGSSAPTAAQLNTTLSDIHGAAYPTSGASSGVFIPSVNNPSTCSPTASPCVKGGGFLIPGNAQILLKPSGTSAQVYQITQGSTVTTITIDSVANTTVITSGTTTLTLNGVPENQITGQPSTMLYVTGSVTGLTGPGEGQGAIQDNSMITITAVGDITATGDVLYKTEPVTYTQDQVVSGSSPACCVGLPMDSLITGRTNMTQVLGLYTAAGNFNLNTTQPDNNIQVDGSIATISAGGCGAFYDTGGYISTFNNVGGQIQNCIVGANISTENIWFDRRFTAVPGFAPPWFPSTNIQQGGPSPTNVTPTIYRVQWLNTTSM